MDVLTARTNRRTTTRVRVEIPVTVTSMDRMHPFHEKCVVLVVSSQGCGFSSSRRLPVGAPIFLTDLPENGSVTARVVNCLPVGTGGQYFLIGAALYTDGNVWKIAKPPQDWDAAAEGVTDAGSWSYS